MNLKPSLDFGIGVGYFLVGGVGALYLFFVAFIIEGLFLHKLLPKSKAFRDSFLINFISALLGVICTAVLFQITTADQEYFFEDIFYNTIPYQRILYYSSILIIILWVLSVLIEGIILTGLESAYRKREIWFAAFFINIVSYLILCIAGWFYLDKWYGG